MAATGQYLRLGCYGKLPFYEEWLEESVSFPSSRALKQWIHEGRRAVLEEQEEAPDGGRKEVGESARRRFLFGLPGSVELVAGVIRPSSDKGGLRPAPFMVFVNLPRRHYGRSYGLLPMALAPVWDALDDAWESLGASATLSGFKEVLASTMVPMPAPSAEVKVAYEGRQREALTRIFESRRDGASLEALARNLPGVLDRLKKGGGRGLRRLLLDRPDQPPVLLEEARALHLPGRNGARGGLSRPVDFRYHRAVRLSLGHEVRSGVSRRVPSRS